MDASSGAKPVRQGNGPWLLAPRVWDDNVVAVGPAVQEDDHHGLELPALRGLRFGNRPDGCGSLVDARRVKLWHQRKEFQEALQGQGLGGLVAGVGPILARAVWDHDLDLAEREVLVVPGVADLDDAACKGQHQSDGGGTTLNIHPRYTSSHISTHFLDPVTPIPAAPVRHERCHARAC